MSGGFLDAKLTRDVLHCIVCNVCNGYSMSYSYSVYLSSNL